MSIFVDENTKVVYQGLTGSQGRFYGLLNRDYGTQVVAGTNPKKAGTDVDGIPIFATVGRRGGGDRRHRVVHLHPRAGREGRGDRGGRGRHRVHRRASPRACPRRTRRGSSTSCKRDFPQRAAARPELPRHHQPRQVQHRHHRRPHRQGGRPGRHREPLGHAHLPGALRAASRRTSASPRASASAATRCRAPASSTASSAFEADPETKAVMMIGEIGGSAEEEAAEFINDKMTKPVVVLHRRRHRACRARRWATPAPSSRAARAPRRPRWRRCATPGVKVGHNPTEAGELMADIVSKL